MRHITMIRNGYVRISKQCCGEKPGSLPCNIVPDEMGSGMVVSDSDRATV